MEDDKLQPEISARKLEANRENAQKSTGPRTAQGKYQSSRNAMKHGLLSKELVIPNGAQKENREEFELLLEDLIEDFEPQTRAELSLVETIAICDWRFRRTLRAETAEIETGIGTALSMDRVLPPADAMNKILRYQTTIHRQKMQALQLLERIQQRRTNSISSADTECDVRKNEFAKRTQEVVCLSND